jgi:hypothetical protein
MTIGLHVKDGGDLLVDGGILVGGSITNRTASEILEASDCKQNRCFHYSQDGTMAAVTAQIIGRVRGTTGTIKSVHAACVTLCTVDATCTIDVKKNGTTILSATIVLDSGNTVWVPEEGTLSVTSAVEDDMISITVTVAAGAGALGTGLTVDVDIDEGYPS